MSEESKLTKYLYRLLIVFPPHLTGQCEQLVSPEPELYVLFISSPLSLYLFFHIFQYHLFLISIPSYISSSSFSFPLHFLCIFSQTYLYHLLIVFPPHLTGQCEQLVSPEPELYVHPRSPSDQFLILACDGIYSVVLSIVLLLCYIIYYIFIMLYYFDAQASKIKFWLMLLSSWSWPVTVFDVLYILLYYHVLLSIFIIYF